MTTDDSFTLSGPDHEYDASGQRKDKPTMDYVLTTFLKVSDVDNGQLPNALENAGISDVTTLTMLDEKSISTLRYSDNSGKRTTMTQLRLADKLLLMAFTKFSVYLQMKTGGAISNNKWFQITLEAFDTFRARPIDSLDAILTPSPTMQTTQQQSNTVPTQNNSQRSAVNDFTKSIKRDKSHYTEFKDEKHWDKWNTGFTIQARAHGMEDILDHKYKPRSPEEQAIFHEKQKFMMSVFYHCLKTDIGKTIVRTHVKTLDAQKVYEELCTHMSKSTGARIAASDTLAYLVNATYDPKTWTSGANSFVLHWLQQARIYNEMVPQERRFHDSALVTLLQKSVKGVPSLRTIQTTAEIASGNSNGKSAADDFEQYKALLLSAATQYDNHFRSKKSQPQDRLINMTDILEDYSDAYDEFDIDTPIQDILEVNMARGKYPSSRNRLQRNPRQQSTWLPVDLFRSFTPDQKAMWLEYKKQLAEQAPGGANGQDRQNTREINFADEYQDAVEEIPSQPPDAETQTDPNPNSDDGIPAEDQRLLAFVAGRESMDPSDIRRIMSTSVTREANVTRYVVSKHEYKSRKGQLVDRGASGGVAGSDLRILSHTSQPPVSVVGLDNHELTNLPIVNAVGLTKTQHGPVILHFNQYAYIARGKSIHSCGQIENYKNEVHDKSRVVGGKQVIKTIDDYVIPIQIRRGLPEIDIRPPTDAEMESYPHVVMTSDEKWDPSVLDFEIDIDDDTWYDTLQGDMAEYDEPRFDLHGDYQFRHAQFHVFDDSPEADQYFAYVAQLATHENDDTFEIFESAISDEIPTPEIQSPSEREEDPPDYEKYVPNFAWMPVSSIKKTFEATTQYAKIIFTGTFRRHYKTRFPAINVPRRPEPVATDYVDIGIPAVDNGSTGAQVFVGVDSKVIDVFGVKTDAEFVNTLEDEIRKRGAMDMIMSDSARSETSKKVKDILRAYRIHDYQSEARHQNQNTAERHYQRLKEATNRVLDRSGAPAHCWLLAMTYVALLLNHVALDSLQGRTPIETLLGFTPDISAFLAFCFFQPVYYATNVRASFPEQPQERLGYWVGVSENVGDAMTWKILDKDTEKIIH